MPSVGAITSNLNIVGATGNYTAKANDFVNASAVSAGLTVTLPTAPATNTLVAVKKVDASTNMVTVVPGGTATINGDTAMGLAVQGGSATLQYDGTNWQVLSTASVNSTTPVGLPTGGTAGQALLKNTTSNYDASWGNVATAPTQAFLPWTSGRTFTVPAPRSVGTNVPFGAGNTYLYSVRVPNACTIASVQFVVAVAAGANTTTTVGLYADTGLAAAGPGLRLATGTVSVTGAATGVFTVTLNYAVAAPATLWTAVSAGTQTFSVSGWALAGTLSNWVMSGAANLTTSYSHLLYAGTQPADLTTGQAFNSASSNQPALCYVIA